MGIFSLGVASADSALGKWKFGWALIPLQIIWNNSWTWSKEDIKEAKAGSRSVEQVFLL